MTTPGITAHIFTVVGGGFNLNASALTSIVANMNPLRAASCSSLLLSGSLSDLAL